MIDYLKTTTIILLMVLALTFVLGVLFGLMAIFRLKAGPTRSRSVWPVPALIAAPSLIALMYLFFRESIIFPSLFDLTTSTLVFYSFFPAIVLVVASGILGNLWVLSFDEAEKWKRSHFFLFSKAMGLPRYKALGKLVFLSTQIQTWARSLPWVFGELIVVEAMFNAPGLGLDIWHFAKTQDTENLLKALLWMIGLYFVSFITYRLIGRWIGQRLQSYA